MKKKRTFNKVAGWQKIKAAIVGEIMEPQSVESRADLMLPAYAALNALETGRLDVDGYFRINEMNCVALCLVARLHAQGSAAVKAAMEVDLLIVRAASDAMSAIGERYNRTGRFGASFEEGCILLLKASEGQSDYDTKVRHVKYWRTVFGGRSICSLTSADISDALPTHHNYAHRKPKKLTAATRNRYLSTVKRIISLADSAGWIGKKPKVSPLKEPSVRVRWLTHGQATAMLNALTLQWVRDACRFALATGCRSNEVFSLTWDKVDVARKQAWVTNDLAKSGKARPVPLNDDALSVLRDRKGFHKSLVFTRVKDGAQIEQVDRRAMGAALKIAGIEDFRFHDLRHTWASWHVQSGTPLFVLKELGGWETIEMVKKYAHLDAGHLSQYANVVTFWSQQEAEKQRATG